MKELGGKKAVVTGGALGIGLSTCKRLVRQGVAVTIWDMNEKCMAEAKSELESMGGTVFTYKCDVSDKNLVEELTLQARKDMGRIDILVNNAGYVRWGNFWERPVEEAIRQFDVNVNAIFYTIHAILPEMIDRNSGHIVNISSSAGFVNSPGLTAYCASKAAVHMLTECLRVEAIAAGKNGVKFSSVHPINIAKGMFEGYSTNALGKLLFPPIKDHDVIAEAIVNNALLKEITVVCIPKIAYASWMMRGVIPNFIWDKMLMALGFGEGVKNFQGRKGFAHTDSSADKTGC